MSKGFGAQLVGQFRSGPDRKVHAGGAPRSVTKLSLVSPAGRGVACVMGVLGGMSRHAAADQHGAGAKGVPAVVIDSSREGICGTCRFWGGMRRTSEDKKAVYAESLGWCNNVDSPNFQTMRTPEAGPMKAWRKWEAL